MSRHGSPELFIEDDRRPPMPRELLLTLAGSWTGSLCMGCTLGYSSPAKHSLASTFKDGLHGFDISVNDWFGKAAANFSPEWVYKLYYCRYDPLLTIGAVLGAVSSGGATQALGRKAMLTVISLGFLSGWTVTYMAQGSTFHIYSGRFITGCSMGLISVLSPAYITEVTLPHNRGTMGGMLQFAITVGILYAYLLGRLLTWDFLALACMVPALALCVASIFCVESPRWHLLNGRKVSLHTL
ncbi:hypothetical protein V5799_016321 [Amblyomma americanum]|uniref:Major facilitator superfamily (MFS) profile domain-containing protein n=1 Tax=Amblyomma americanum TaxID=6943 RepID=A0AAQ4F6S0_AMBAM